MAPPEQFASVHDSFVELLRHMSRRKLVELVCAAGGIELGDIVEIEEHTPTVEVPGLFRRARRGIVDLVLVVRTADGRTYVIVIVECQLNWDPNKIWDWALFPVAFAAEARKRAFLAVMCPEARLRARYRRALVGVQPCPILIEPDHITLIDDDHESLSDPHQATFTAIYHAGEATPEVKQVAAIQAALLAIETLEPMLQLRYKLLMETLVPPHVFESALEQLRAKVDSYDFEGITDAERQGWLYHKVRDQGLRDGFEKGVIESLQRSLLDILELRGFVVTAATKQTVETCAHRPTLEAWYTRARSCPLGTSLDAILATLD